MAGAAIMPVPQISGPGCTQVSCNLQEEARCMHGPHTAWKAVDADVGTHASLAAVASAATLLHCHALSLAVAFAIS